LESPCYAAGALPLRDNENSELVALVNERFLERFFKSGEDPLDQHFGLDYPGNAGTFRIVGVVREAKFAGWRLNLPAQRSLCSTCRSLRRSINKRR
jgi:hypothetical protein